MLYSTSGKVMLPQKMSKEIRFFKKSSMISQDGKLEKKYLEEKGKLQIFVLLTTKKPRMQRIFKQQ